MPDNSLPDEIISEILSPALRVADEVFSDNSENASPFSTYSESTSAYLVVCKSWLRVATPLLYNVVVLRSKAQAKALAGALSANKDLGQFIKKLRVEGGYGAYMYTILQNAPHMSDLFISFEIYSSDSTDGLCKGLPLISPTRLILRDKLYRAPKNKMLFNLVHAMAQEIPKWTNLSIFDCPYSWGEERITSLVQALVEAKRLHTLVIPGSYAIIWGFRAFKDCPLQDIILKQPVSLLELKEDLEWADESALKPLLRYTTRPDFDDESTARPVANELPPIVPALNPFFIPMSAAETEVQDAIWSLVLYFAMSVPEREDALEKEGLPASFPLLLVSKTFYRLGLPHFYTHILLKTTRAAASLASTLSGRASLGPHVRTITARLPRFRYFGDSDSNSDSDHEGEQASGNSLPNDRASTHRRSTKSAPDSTGNSQFDSSDPMIAILLRTSNLLRLSSTSKRLPVFMRDEISWAAFVAMAGCAGATLQECTIRIRSAANAQAAVFNDLLALQKLIWDCKASFAVDDSSSTLLADALPNLSDLRIAVADESFTSILGLMKLPSLRRVEISDDNVLVHKLFSEHGTRLCELALPRDSLSSVPPCILDLCSNLYALTILWDDSPAANGFPPDAKAFQSTEPAASLTTIKFVFPEYFKTKEVLAGWEAFFRNFPFESVPNLSEIQVTSFAWPTSEREIAKSSWVKVAESMLERDPAISLLDNTGKKWKMRLRASGRKTRR